MNDPINNPEHYRFGQMDAWDIIELAIEDIDDPVTAYHTASALKYLLRAARKNGDQDIAKANAHLTREVARHAVRIPPPPEYNPGSVAFRHGDTVTFDRAPDADQPIPSGWGWLGEADSVCVTFPNGDFHVVRQKTAAELADADGCIEYGNPVTPGCAPWRLP